MFKTATFAAILVGGLALGAPGASAASIGDPAGVAAATTAGVETVQYYGRPYYGPRRYYGGPRRFYGGPRYYGGPRRFGPRFYGPRPMYRGPRYWG